MVSIGKGLAAMAVYLPQLNPFPKKLLSRFLDFRAGTIRFAAVGEVKLPSKKKRGDFGERVPNGAFVKPGTILVEQKKLVACPGLNVGVAKFGLLYAKVAGKVVVTYEKTDLNTDNHLVYQEYPDELPTYRTYYNVIPNPQHQRFKLIDTI